MKLMQIETFAHLKANIPLKNKPNQKRLAIFCLLKSCFYTRCCSLEFVHVHCKRFTPVMHYFEVSLKHTCMQQYVKQLSENRKFYCCEGAM